MAKSKIVICPYCGEPQPASDRCRACTGLFEPLSRQVTQNDMGPWYIRNVFRPFQPGCSYETLVRLIERGVVTKMSIIRGPTTKQFWTVAKRVPGLSHLFGYCHNCDALVDPSAHGCHNCGVPFGAYLDRNHLGLADVKPLPWEAPLVETGTAARNGEQVGISSFASDAELTSQASYGGAGPATMAASDADSTIVTTDEASRMGRLTSTVPQSANPAQSQTASQPMASLSTVQALQRQLEHQKRTTRNLMIGIGGISVVVFVLLIRMAAVGGGETPSTPPSTAPSNPIGSESLSTQDHADSGAMRDQLNAGNSNSTSNQSAMTSPAVTPPAVNSQSVPENAAASRAAAEKQLGELQQRFEHAKDESQNLDVRIAELQGVLDALNEINAADLPKGQQGDLQKLQADASQLLAQLNLKKFFP
ncbi:MAG TPA: hypothetical protein VG711_11720 [Phycisphaerales bacterium]|nr:hypothetical protein [Phycisphaerales bacterium]